MRFGSSIIDGYVSGIISSLEQSISDSGYGTIDINSVFSMTDILYGVAIGMICFGLFLLIITILGILGGCCNMRVMLIIVSIREDLPSILLTFLHLLTHLSLMEFLTRINWTNPVRI